jgi:hypothetical protein
MNSQCPIRTKRWSVSAGRADCADHAESRLDVTRKAR